MILLDAMNGDPQASGSSHGHAVYGIKKLSAYAPRLQSILEDCVAAAGSTDARDKYFANYVGEFALSSSKELRSELPSMEVGTAVNQVFKSVWLAWSSLYWLFCACFHFYSEHAQH